MIEHQTMYHPSNIDIAARRAIVRVSDVTEPRRSHWFHRLRRDGPR